MWVRAGGVRARSSAIWARASRLIPIALIYPQDEHERLLIERLAALGVEVERRCELAELRGAGRRCVIARLKRPDGTLETCEAAYLAGCDGAHSAVRNALGIGFGGGTYAHLFYVADVQAARGDARRELHVALDTTDFLIVFPRRPAGTVRLVGNGARGRRAHIAAANRPGRT